MRTSMTLSLGFSLLLAACGGDAKKKPTVATSQPESEETAGPAEENAPEVVEELDSQPSASLTAILYFAHDNSELDTEAKAALEANAEWMNEDKTRVLTIEGHTDETGTSGYNLALGEKRARTSKDYLTRLGVSADRIEIITYGEERPASGSDSENRRSVFVGSRK